MLTVQQLGDRVRTRARQFGNAAVSQNWPRRVEHAAIWSLAMRSHIAIDRSLYVDGGRGLYACTALDDDDDDNDSVRPHLDHDYRLGILCSAEAEGKNSCSSSF